jgi:hypothetical protein
MVRRKSVYRTSQGQSVDFGAMLAQNETVPALGNMNVNARGDEIASDGSIVKSREDVMKEYNKLNTMIPTDDGIPEGTAVNNNIIEDDWNDWEPPVETVPETRSYIVTPEPVVAEVIPKIEKINQISDNPEIQEETQGDDMSKGTNIGSMIASQHTPPKVTVPAGSFAQAVAESKVIKDPDLKTPEQTIKDAEGVKRI